MPTICVKPKDQGNATAQLNLGLRYGRGEGVAQDYTQARFWYRKAADQGNALAQGNLGVMYSRGTDLLVESFPDILNAEFTAGSEWSPSAATGTAVLSVT